MRTATSMALGTFADCALYGDPDWKGRAYRRDVGAGIVANFACPECGAPAGKLCTRNTVAGEVDRRLPHFGRGLQSSPHNRMRRLPVQRPRRKAAR